MCAKYADIISLPRPVTDRRRMPASERAKIFAPFAALGDLSAPSDEKAAPDPGHGGRRIV